MRTEVISTNQWRDLSYRGGLQKQTNFTPNVPLLRKMVEWVEEEAVNAGLRDKSWDQSVWVHFVREIARDSLGRFTSQSVGQVCRTNCCVAGNVAITMGTLVFKSRLANEPAFVKDDQGRYWEIEVFAADQLGLNEKEKEMFAGNNGANSIRAYAEMAADRIGETL